MGANKDGLVSIYSLPAGSSTFYITKVTFRWSRRLNSSNPLWTQRRRAQPPCAPLDWLSFLKLTVWIVAFGDLHVKAAMDGFARGTRPAHPGRSPGEGPENGRAGDHVVGRIGGGRSAREERSDGHHQCQGAGEDLESVEGAGRGAGGGFFEAPRRGCLFSGQQARYAPGNPR